MYMLRVPNRLSHVLVPLTGLSDSERSGAHVLPQQLTTLHRELTAHKAHGSIAQAVEAFFCFHQSLSAAAKYKAVRMRKVSSPSAESRRRCGRVRHGCGRASSGADVGESRLRGARQARPSRIPRRLPRPRAAKTRRPMHGWAAVTAARRMHCYVGAHGVRRACHMGLVGCVGNA
jgi:hypothetical protein